MSDIYKVGPYEFERKHYSRYMDTLTSLKSLPENVKLYTRDGEQLARSGDTFFLTSVDDVITVKIDGVTVYKMYKKTDWYVFEVPTH